MQPSLKLIVFLTVISCFGGCSGNGDKFDVQNTTNTASAPTMGNMALDNVATRMAFNDTANMAVPTPAAVPTVPDHNFGFRDGNSYGYIGGLSDEDRKNGKAAGDVFMFTYLGHWGEAYHLAEINDAGQVTSSYECDTNCIAIKSYRFGTVRRIEYAPGSIIGAAFQDAMRGKLRERPKEVQLPAPYVPQPQLYQTQAANSVEPVASNETPTNEQQ